MKKFIRTIIFLVFFALILCAFNALLKPAHANEIAMDNYKYPSEEYYALEKNSLDVLWIGSSHVFTAISPEDIWHSSGLTSYVQGSSSQRIWQTYYLLEESLKTQSPKLVFVDALFFCDITPQNEAFNRELLDYTRTDFIKLKAARVAINKDVLGEEDTIFSYLAPALRYHDRWDSLDTSDVFKFKANNHSITKGYYPRLGYTPVEVDNLDEYISNYYNSFDGYKSDFVIPDESLLYINKIKSLCEKNDSELIVVKFPTIYWNADQYNAVSDWCNGQEVKYLDFVANEDLREAVSIDWSNDTLDGGNHINYYGAMKLTQFMSEWINKNYSFSDKRNNSDYASWNEDYEYYKECVRLNE